jgi:hypothetical protein
MTKQEKARWLSEIYTAVAEGRTMQYVVDGTWWDQQCGPDMNSDLECWRIKPEPREVETLVYHRNGNERWVRIPDDWFGVVTVRVTEILEDTALREVE